MSLTKTIGVSGALIFSAVLLANGVNSRKSLDQETPTQITAADTSMVVHSISSDNHKSAAEVKLHLENKLPGMQIDTIEQSPLDGFYQAFFAGELIYISKDGEYLFTGNLLELAGGRPVNHSQLAIAAQDAKKAPMRAASIAEIDESDMVLFKAKNEEFVVTVFTDVDCAYCRKLHKDVPKLNAKGITVRYLAYPRAGIGSDAYRKLVSVWCADDKAAAMDDAKLKREFGDKVCENPIASQFNMTRKFNLSGTPSIILSNGEVIGGYLPAEELYGILSQKQAKLNKEAG